MASITLSFHSEALERTVPLRALVPLEDAPRVPMPALYLLHGLYGSEQDWFQYTRVMLWARAKGLAVFCPAGENGFYVNQADTGEAYMRYVGEELPAFTRRLFPLSSRREDTFIAGLSMGGYGALNAGLTYPETFGKVAALSAALRPWKRMDKPQGGCVQRPAYARIRSRGIRLPWPGSAARVPRNCGFPAAPRMTCWRKTSPWWTDCSRRASRRISISRRERTTGTSGIGRPSGSLTG